MAAMIHPDNDIRWFRGSQKFAADSRSLLHGFVSAVAQQLKLFKCSSDPLAACCAISVGLSPPKAISTVTGGFQSVWTCYLHKSTLLSRFRANASYNLIQLQQKYDRIHVLPGFLRLRLNLHSASRRKLFTQDSDNVFLYAPDAGTRALVFAARTFVLRE
ncbi:hypothetical protein CYMTET_27727 [Cymbomonas tetramitiformis]|uniref:Uncharacterized protein n=1 Tax=Cymbomonas tetramitiformis TaxID=36881 RepID=A0AAE0FPC6_9CHLO|nr:hypothetical protein CYMTET_27727 [Cymbomonas tetramitiformis]